MASLLGTPSAIVRPHFVSGTHAIAAALFGALRPGDCLVAAAGAPYDTLEEVIGLSSRILVMRDGAITARLEAPPGGKPQQVELLRHMV